MPSRPSPGSGRGRTGIHHPRRSDHAHVRLGIPTVGSYRSRGGISTGPGAGFDRRHRLRPDAPRQGYDQDHSGRSIAGVIELLLLLLGTAFYLSPLAVSALRDRAFGLAVPLLLFATGDDRQHPELFRIFLVFLKIGSILYGSGYVLIAFLQRDLVDHRHWLTQQQLLDAVAVGQVTPGPLFTTSTFIGYLVGGWDGALVATTGIFLPAFLFVLASHRFVDRMRASATLSRALDGLNLASNALLIGVLLTLIRDLDRSAMPVLIVAGAVIVLASRRAGPTPVLIAAGLIGSVWTAF